MDRVIKIKDSSNSATWNLCEDIQLFEVGGKNPAENNFCMEVYISERQNEEMVCEMDGFYYEDFDGQENSIIANQIAREECARKISYYVGVVKARFMPLDETEIMADVPEVLLYSTSRFETLSVREMLLAILNDKEILEYLKTGTRNSKEALYSVDTNTQINLNDYMSEGDRGFSESEVEEILAEYEYICEFEKLQNRLVKKETSISEKDGREIHPYSINMALLFEAYARACVRKSIEAQGYEMLSYVANKADDETKGEGYGAKTIVKKQIEEEQQLKLQGLKKPYYFGSICPDIVLRKKDNPHEYKILDVKYKNPIDRNDRDDRLQILAYAYMYNANEIGHIFPENGVSKDSLFTINAGTHEVTYEMKFIK